MLEYTYTSGKKVTKDVTNDVTFGNATPANTYKISNVTFKYDVPLYYEGKAINGAAVTAYIGVKGDANLSNDVDALDASALLSYYAKVQVSATLDKGIKLTQDDPKLDSLAAFLADVDADEYEPTNFATSKTDAGRTINPLDASNILTFYANKQVSPQGTQANTIWSKIFGEKIIGFKK